MLAPNRSPAATAAASPHKQLHKSGRKPLQPRNFELDPIPIHGGSATKPKPDPAASPLFLWTVNKENDPSCRIPEAAVEIGSFDPSLAEELSAARKKAERLRVDTERTERMLSERDAVLNVQMREIQRRGEEQKELEMEVDRLYRLKQLKNSCTAFSPIKSLREKERVKKIEESQQSQQIDEVGEGDESTGENDLQSPQSSPRENIIAEE